MTAVAVLVTVSVQQVYATSEVIVNPNTCEELGGSWNDATCTVINHVNDGIIRVPDDITLKIIGKFENNGVVITDERGTVTINGWGQFANGKIINDGIMDNNGTLECKRCGFYNQNAILNSGYFYTDFKIHNSDTFYNMGLVHNDGEVLNKENFFSCLGMVTGNPITGNPPVKIC